ncbi:hypothetical protein VHEMI03334 [[Torrubiella] hemipterigena]|uniref:Rho-GAP domain-containing protein n=1 Tax=[Torrubiella] hemipterigena TaxID=1531966 RepID=A0A0A1SSA2_9HYPO|nr:hypothetical protein VHEMI03334 [[Torrubiella] hemipterigena]
MRLLISDDFKTVEERPLESNPGWFRRMFRSSSQQKPPAESVLRQQTSRRRRGSDLAYAIHSKRDAPLQLDLISMVRLSGKSLLHLPNEYSPCGLHLPTCLRATAQHLAQNPGVNGLFRIPGSVKAVNGLVEYYCRVDKGGTEVTGTVRYASLPAHMQCSVHEVASAFKRLLSMLPGGILGSLSVFDAFIAIHSQLGTNIETSRTKQTKIKARLIALVVGSVESQYRRELICSVLGLLCMIGRHAETAPREDIEGKPLPTNDLMGYRALGIIFGPLLVGDLLDKYSTHLATLESGLVVLPAIASSNWAGGASMNKITIANEVAEMLISCWRDVVRQMKALGVHRHRSGASALKGGIRNQSSLQHLDYRNSDESEINLETNPKLSKGKNLVISRKRPQRQPGTQPTTSAQRHDNNPHDTNTNDDVFYIKGEELYTPNKVKRLDSRRRRLERLQGYHLESLEPQTQIAYEQRHSERISLGNSPSKISSKFHTLTHYQPEPNSTTITRSKPREHLRPISISAGKRRHIEDTLPEHSPNSERKREETGSKRSSVRTLAAMFENQNSPSPGSINYNDRSIRPRRSEISTMKASGRINTISENTNTKGKLSTPRHSSKIPERSPIQTRSGGVRSRIPVTKTVRHAISDSGPLFDKRSPKSYVESPAESSRKAEIHTKQLTPSSKRASCGCQRNVASLQHSKDANKGKAKEKQLPSSREHKESRTNKLPEVAALYIIIDRLYEVLKETSREADGLRTKLKSQSEILEASQLDSTQSDSTYEELLQLRAEVFRWRLKAETAEKKLAAFERFANKVHHIKEVAISSEGCCDDESHSDATITQSLVTRGDEETSVNREQGGAKAPAKGRYDGASSDKAISITTSVEDLGLISEEDLDSIYGDVASLWQAARTLLETGGMQE